MLCLEAERSVRKVSFGDSSSAWSLKASFPGGTSFSQSCTDAPSQWFHSSETGFCCVDQASLQLASAFPVLRLQVDLPPCLELHWLLKIGDHYIVLNVPLMIYNSSHVCSGGDISVCPVCSHHSSQTLQGVFGVSTSSPSGTAASCMSNSGPCSTVTLLFPANILALIIWVHLFLTFYYVDMFIERFLFLFFNFKLWGRVSLQSWYTELPM